MKNNRKILKKSLAVAVAAAGLVSVTAQAYGPLYIFDYESGTPYRWDVTEPVQVYTDGGNYASGTVRLRNPDLDTCNAEGGWQCYEDVYVEFTNEQGVARVSDALNSWSSVPTSSFQAEVAGSFADIGIGGDDGDITGAPEEFFEIDGVIFHEVIGTENGGGIHVMYDHDGSITSGFFGAPPGVLGIASPEYGIPATGPLTDEQARSMIHGYYAAISYVDAQVGRLLDELERAVDDHSALAAFMPGAWTMSTLRVAASKFVALHHRPISPRWKPWSLASTTMVLPARSRRSSASCRPSSSAIACQSSEPYTAGSRSCCSSSS